MKRNMNAMVALLGLSAAVGCENLGLYDAGTAEEGRQRPPPALAASVNEPAAEAGAQELIVDGRLWVASGRRQALDEQDLRPIGSANGQTLHARSWDRPPYDELFAPVEEEARAGFAARGGWQGYRPVVGGDRRGGSTEAAEETGTEEADGH